MLLLKVADEVKQIKPLPLTFERVRSQVLNDYIAAAKKRLGDADLRVSAGQGRHPGRRRLR
jgi:hypothetical protein